MNARTTRERDRTYNLKSQVKLFSQKHSLEKMIQRVSKEYIAIDPEYCFGKPRIVGTRMPVATIAKMHLEMRESLEEIAAEYTLSKAAVYAAMSYYYDHQEEIDRHTAESEILVEEMKRNSPPSPLQERLRAIQGE